MADRVLGWVRFVDDGPAVFRTIGPQPSEQGVFESEGWIAVVPDPETAFSPASALGAPPATLVGRFRPYELPADELNNVRAAVLRVLGSIEPLERHMDNIDYARQDGELVIAWENVGMLAEAAGRLADAVAVVKVRADLLRGRA